MRGQFDVEPIDDVDDDDDDDDDETYWEKHYTHTEERWNRWKCRLMAIRDAAKRNDVLENADAAVKAMENCVEN